MVQLALVLLLKKSMPSPSSEGTMTNIMETGSSSALASLEPTIDILEGLTTHVIDQFFHMLGYGTKLVLSGKSSFEFIRMLLEDYVENIK